MFMTVMFLYSLLVKDGEELQPQTTQKILIYWYKLIKVVLLQLPVPLQRKLRKQIRGNTFNNNGTKINHHTIGDDEEYTLQMDLI